MFNIGSFTITLLCVSHKHIQKTLGFALATVRQPHANGSSVWQPGLVDFNVCLQIIKLVKVNPAEQQHNFFHPDC